MRTFLRRRSAARDGAAMVFFLLVLLPMVFVGLALSFDAATAFATRRAMEDAAVSAAQAGAQQYVPNTKVLNEAAARGVAERSLDLWVEGGNGRQGIGNVEVTGRNARVYGRQVVELRVRYTIEGLTFLSILENLFPGNQDWGDLPTSITTRASICDATRPIGPTDGHCRRPSL